jgi:hypothetical protein
VLVHGAEGVDQLPVGAVALGVAGQLVPAGRVLDALERLRDAWTAGGSAGLVEEVV